VPQRVLFDGAGRFYIFKSFKLSAPSAQGKHYPGSPRVPYPRGRTEPRRLTLVFRWRPKTLLAGDVAAGGQREPARRSTSWRAATSIRRAIIGGRTGNALDV